MGWSEHSAGLWCLSICSHFCVGGSFCWEMEGRERVYNDGISGTGGAAMRTKTRATIENLYKVEGKAELVNGEIVCTSPSGDEPSIAGGEIFAHLL